MDLSNIILPDPAADDPADDAILERNLAAIANRAPQTAELIRQTPPHPAVEFIATDEGFDGLVVEGRTLASRKRPKTEGQRLAGSIDLGENACVCVLGFAAGHHCAALGRKLGRMGLIVCFEPDLPLLRAVLGQIDHSDWIEKTNFVLLCDADDRSQFVAALTGLEGVIGMGVKLLAHPPSAPRLGDHANRFAHRFTEIVLATRTQVTTTLVQAERTLRNMLMNIDRYAGAGGIASLTGAALAKPAVVVSAGPSVRRNLDLLAQPAMRDRVVIIAVQTMLRPMLARGIKPHFVTTLDYHEISRRFYEGLNAEDVTGITLIAEPKVNPAVLEAWPGAVRFCASQQLDSILGPALAGDKGEIKPGATVAHLSHYFARHLGCDPVILIGQDLAFTDGQYYAAGAAIHNTWASELGPFRTLETLEWERIARGKNTLRRGVDVYGRPIFTDDQMASYLAQFEGDFAEDARAGLRVIDATEGGIVKQHTTPMTLAAALERYAQHPAPGTTPTPSTPHGAQPERIINRVNEVINQCERITHLSEKTAALLDKMKKHRADQRRINKDITQIDTISREVTSLDPAWRLTQFIDQNGVLLRVKADRKIELGDNLSPQDRQRAQIERDRDNVHRAGQAAAHLSTMLAETRAMLDRSGPRLTRDPITQTDDAPADIELGSLGRIEAIIPVDPDCCGLAAPRDLARPIHHGYNALQLTAARLLRAGRLDGITLLTGEPVRVRTLLGDALAADPRITITQADAARIRDRFTGVGRARLFGPDAWRGGIAGLTCYDEAFDPTLAIATMESRNLSAAVIVGADWCLVDPAIIDAVIERHAEHPARNRIVFTQAAPGLAGMLLDRKTVRSLADACDQGGMRATIGGIIAYQPHNPRRDPIATSLCVPVEPAVRDCGRAIPDAAPRLERIKSVLDKLGSGSDCADAPQLARRLARTAPDPAPQHLTLEVCTGRLTSGPWGQRVRGSAEPVERPVLSMPDAHRVLKQLAKSREDAALTLAGVGDPLMHDRWFELVQMAEELGIAAVHLRTELNAERFQPERFAESGLAALSIDMIAGDRESYRSLAGVDRFEAVTQRARALLDAQNAADKRAGLPALWIVPHMMRCDEVYEQVPDWYDRWALAAGFALLDPLPAPVAGARIEPLPLPPSAQRRTDRSHMVVRSDLSVAGLDDASLATEPLPDAWRRLVLARRQRAIQLESKPTPSPAVA